MDLSRLFFDLRSMNIFSIHCHIASSLSKSAMGLHSSLFCNPAVPSCSSFSSICASVLPVGAWGHRLCCKNLLAGAIHKSLINAGVILFRLMPRSGGRCSSGEGSWHGLEVRSTQVFAENSKVVQKLATSLALAAMVITTQPWLDPASASQLRPAIPDAFKLMSGPPITDPNALPRYALPVDNKPIKDIQRNLENITGNLKVPGMKALKSVEMNVKQAALVLNRSMPEILADIAESKKDNGRELVDALILGLQDFQKLVEARDRDAIALKQKELLDIIGRVEEDMVDKFPFDVPEDYASKPLLKGRATVEMKIKVKDNPNLEDVVLQLVLDGYNAPVTAGNFVDLIERHFYDGMEIQRADGCVVKTGDPKGPAEGFVDPSTDQIRTIPLEIMVRGERSPIYGATLEELGQYNAQPKLPFNAFGTMAMARNEFEDNSASSQVFWFLKESEYTSSSSNMLDGRYTVFGYVTENQGYLSDLKVGDVIESMRVVSGIGNLVNPSYKIVG